MSTGWQLGQEFRRNLTKSTALESPSDDCKMAARVTHRVPKHRLVHLNHVHSRSTLGIVTAAAPRTPVQCWGEPEASGAKGCRRSRDATHRCVHAHARRHTHTQAHTRMHAHAHTRRHTHARTHTHTHAHREMSPYCQAASAAGTSAMGLCRSKCKRDRNQQHTRSIHT
jgi:hypothetical protein